MTLTNDNSQATDNQAWYIVKQTNGICEIVGSASPPPAETIWGPFQSQPEAIAKRVGLIRAGLCQPQ